MDIKQNPFSLYDFLGYLIPGAMLLYGIAAAISHVDQGLNAFDEIAKHTGFKRAELYAPFVLTAYTAGHLLSFLSSITIERYSIWMFGYPSKYLLNIPHVGYYSVDEKKFIRGVLRTVVWIVMFPVTVLDFVLGRWAGFRDLYAKGLDPLLVNVINGKVKDLLVNHAGLKSPTAQGWPANHDYFRYVYHFAIEHADNHLQKMQNYIALFGFLRTLTLLSIIFFWVIVCHGVMEPVSYLPFIKLAVFSSLVSYIFFMGFEKFYRRFSLEALMAFCVTYPESVDVNPSVPESKKRK